MFQPPLQDLTPEEMRRLLLHWQAEADVEPPTLEAARARQDRRGLANPLPDGCAVQELRLGAVVAERLVPQAVEDGRTILYLHGGGFVQGSPRAIRHFAARLAHATGATAYVPGYRLAPEHPFPQGLDDAVAAYQAVLDQGVAPGKIVLAGDSAGGGLVVSLAIAARDRGLPIPAAIHAISPWSDLTLQSPAYALKAESDVFCTLSGLESASRQYLGGTDAHDPLASPVFADLSGLPPLLIQVGSEEVLLCDSTRLAERAALARVEVRLDVFPGAPHGFPLFYRQLSAARRAIVEAGAWLASRIR